MLIGTMSVSVLGVVRCESWWTCLVLTHISRLHTGRSWSRRREWTSFISSLLTAVMHGLLLPDHWSLELSERKILSHWGLRSSPLSQASVFNITCLMLTHDRCFTLKVKSAGMLFCSRTLLHFYTVTNGCAMKLPGTSTVLCSFEG